MNVTNLPAEIPKWRYVQACEGRDEAYEELAEARAALDRVRALCDEWDTSEDSPYRSLGNERCAKALRAALDGPGE